MMALRKLALMHQQFGVCYGHSCGECSNLVSGRYRGRILRKCKVYGLTHSEASDWAKRWVSQAIVGGHCIQCGFYKKCTTDKHFKFPVFAWCMRRKDEILADWKKGGAK